MVNKSQGLDPFQGSGLKVEHKLHGFIGDLCFSPIRLVKTKKDPEDWKREDLTLTTYPARCSLLTQCRPNISLAYLEDADIPCYCQ